MQQNAYRTESDTLRCNLDSRRVKVVGAAISGQNAAILAARLGAEVCLLESNVARITPELRSVMDKHGVRLKSGGHQAEDFADSDLVVLSPGVPARKIIPLLPEEKQGQSGIIISELELAWRFSDAPVLAITGTNGKTTTTTLAAKMLEASGRKVFLGGNIGTPLSAYVLGRLDGQEQADVLVLEVSSFQLQGCLHFRPDAAVFLNFSPNHLDWHLDMEEYLSAKLNIFVNQKADDLAVMPEELYRRLAGRLPGRAAVSCFDSFEDPSFDAPYLPGRHNRGNIAAAYVAAGHFRLDDEKVRAMLKEFKGLPHRMEHLGVINAVEFVNDSKSTTVDSLRIALEAVEKPVHLLAGGVFKGGDLAGLLDIMRRKVKSIALFGASREVFEAAWAGQFPLSWSEAMAGAFTAAWEKASPGETILLSPATSSFDLYSNYKARGDDFRRLFESLQQKASK